MIQVFNEDCNDCAIFVERAVFYLPDWSGVLSHEACHQSF